MYINTARLPWAQLRALVAGDDTPISAFDFSDWPSANTIKLNDEPLKDANGVIIAFHGADAADEDTTYKLYGRTRNNGPVQLLLEGTIFLGTQNATTDPITGDTITNGEWADTITVTGGILSGLVEILDSGNNRICMLKFDQLHIDELFCEIVLTGGSTTAASMAGIITGW